MINKILKNSKLIYSWDIFRELILKIKQNTHKNIHLLVYIICKYTYSMHSIKF